MTKRKRVLVVDDVDDWRRRVSEVVIACGHEPITAKDEVEAEQLLDNERFAIIITDNQMRFTDSGIDLLEGEWLSDREIPSILHTTELSALHKERLAKPELAHVQVVLKSLTNSTALTETIQKLLADSE